MNLVIYVALVTYHSQFMKSWLQVNYLNWRSTTVSKKKKLYIYRRHIVLGIANIMLINLSQFLVMVGNLLVDRRFISQSQLIVVHGTLPHRP